RPLEHLELQRLLGAEVGEQSALRQAHPRRQHTEGEPFEPHLAGQGERPLHDLLLGLLALAQHGERENSTTGRLSQGGASRIISSSVSPWSRSTSAARRSSTARWLTYPLSVISPVWIDGGSASRRARAMRRLLARWAALWAARPFRR